MGTLLTFAERLFHQVMGDTLKPPPPVDYIRFAVDNITFAEGESQKQGPYDRDAFGFFDEILRALSPEDPCRIVTLAKSAQIGGTILASIFAAGSLVLAPGNFMYTHPTEENARRWSKMKFAPLVRSTPALQAIFSQKSRDGADSLLYKERIDGRGAIQISGSNSAASLSQVTMPRQVQDDLSKWETNSAGDPEGQADSRSFAIEFAKLFKISTPLVMPGCRITANFEAGSQEHPYVPCPHCGHMQVLTWENMLQHLDEDAPERAHFVCLDAECGGVIENYHIPRMRRGLEWRAHNPSARRVHRSFWIWSAYSDLQSFERIARAWLKAKGNPEAEKTFLNDVTGLAYRAQGEAPPWEALRDRAEGSHYARGQVPAGCLLLFMGLDCQDDRVEWQVVGFGRSGRRYVVEYGIVRGHISEPATRAVLDELQKQTWPNSAGRLIGIEMAAIDGNAWTEDVWGWAKRHPSSRVVMVRGRGEDHVPLLAPVKKERDKRGNLLKYSRRFYNFGTSILKMSLYRNLAKTDPLADGYVAFPRGLEDEYFRQLTAERRVPKVKHGFISYVWDKDRTQANEGLDTHLQAEAAAIKFNVRAMPETLWERYEAEREVPEAAPQLDFEDLPIFAAPPASALPPTAAVPASAAPSSPPRRGGLAALAALNRRR